jgi:hydroxymethylbilane synthase
MIQQIAPEVSVQKVIITTAGDADRKTPLYSLGEKGIFESEIDEAVLDGRVDFAVHSLKDLPVFDSATELRLAGMPQRASPADVLVTRSGKGLLDLEAGSRVGTSSLLRMSQLKRVRPELRPEPIRGNVETRVRKVETGEYDAVILAEAGLSRLGLEERISEKLSLNDFMPAPGQGTIATVARENSSTTIKLLEGIDHPSTHSEAMAEREIVRLLQGGCKVPIGALASVDGQTITLTAYVLSSDGKERLETRKTDTVNGALRIAREAANDLLAQGAKRLEADWRKIYA